MGFIIKVPDNEINLQDNVGNTIEKRNYFWLMTLQAILQFSQRLKGTELLDFNEIWQLVKSQNNQKSLSFGRDSDYEKVKGIIENHTGWIGTDAPESASIVIKAYRSAEHFEPEPEEKKK